MAEEEPQELEAAPKTEQALPPLGSKERTFALAAEQQEAKIGKPSRPSWTSRHPFGVPVIIAALLCLVIAGSSIFLSQNVGVAARVNGKPIQEAAVTEMIQQFRASQELENDADWAQYLSDNGFTPEDIRSQAISSLAQLEVLHEAADKAGYAVDSSDVDEYIAQVKSSYPTDASWDAALSKLGLTDESYRQDVEDQVLTMQLYSNSDLASAYQSLLASSPIEVYQMPENLIYDVD